MSLPRPSIVVRFTRLLASAALLVAGLATPVSAAPAPLESPGPSCGTVVTNGFGTIPSNVANIRMRTAGHG